MLGTTTDFDGTILALTSITMNPGASDAGGLFAQTGAVTLDDNAVTATTLRGHTGSGPRHHDHHHDHHHHNYDGTPHDDHDGNPRDPDAEAQGRGEGP